MANFNKQIINLKEYFFGKSRLRLKLVFLLASVALIPLLLLGFISIYSINTNRQFEISSLENQLISQKIKQIDGFFTETMESLRFQFGYKEAQIPDWPGQEFLLKNFMQVLPHLEEVSFVAVVPQDNFGKETFRISRDPYFSCALRPDKESEFGFQIENCPRGPQDDPKSLKNLQFTEEFQIAQNGRDYISPVMQTMSGPKLMVALPIKNIDNVIVGVVTARISLSPVVRFIEQSNLGSKGYIYLIDENGIVVASSLPDLKTQSYQASRISFVSSVISGLKRSGLEPDDIYSNVFGDKVVGAGDIIKKTGWAVIAEWPEDDAFAPSTRLRNQIISFSGALAAVIFLAATFAANRVIQPIKELVEGTKIIGEGKFDYKIDVKTKDELENLGKAFNEMAKSLKRLAELREEFVFVAAHELRTPVTAIKGYISMLLEGSAGKISKNTAEFLKKVQSSNDRLVQLVRDLLEVARSEAGRLKISLNPQNIAESVNQVFDELKPLTDERKIIFEYEKPAKELVMADNDRLKEVLVNLVGNAIKYNKDKGKITVSHKKDGDMLVTIIADTGIGLKQEEMSKLFEKFWRAENEATRAQTGTGLGLFIVKELIGKMGGKIWAESEWGKGTKFYFSLPVAK